jgi:hypothetical protein
MKLPLFLMVFVNVHNHFRIWTRIRIRNPRVTDPVPDPAKVPDPCGSGSGSGATTLIIHYLADISRKGKKVFSHLTFHFAYQ